MKVSEALGNMIREARTERGMTQAGLGRRLGVSYAAVSNWESGKVVPTERYASIISEYLPNIDSDFQELHRQAVLSKEKGRMIPVFNPSAPSFEGMPDIFKMIYTKSRKLLINNANKRTPSEDKRADFAWIVNSDNLASEGIIKGDELQLTTSFKPGTDKIVLCNVNGETACKHYKRVNDTKYGGNEIFILYDDKGIVYASERDPVDHIIGKVVAMKRFF